MARELPSSRVVPLKIDSDDAYNQVISRKQDLDRDLKVDQIHDQPGRGRRPARRITRKSTR